MFPCRGPDPPRKAPNSRTPRGVPETPTRSCASPPPTRLSNTTVSVASTPQDKVNRGLSLQAELAPAVRCASPVRRSNSPVRRSNSPVRGNYPETVETDREMATPRAIAVPSTEIPVLSARPLVAAPTTECSPVVSFTPSIVGCHTPAPSTTPSYRPTMLPPPTILAQGITAAGNKQSGGPGLTAAACGSSSPAPGARTPVLAGSLTVTTGGGSLTAPPGGGSLTTAAAGSSTPAPGAWSHMLAGSLTVTAAGGSLTATPGGASSTAAPGSSLTRSAGNSLTVAPGNALAHAVGGSFQVSAAGAMSPDAKGSLTPRMDCRSISPPKVVVPPSPRAISGRATQPAQTPRHGDANTVAASPAGPSRRSLPSSPQHLFPTRLADHIAAVVGQSKLAQTPRGSLTSRSSSYQHRGNALDAGGSIAMPMGHSARISRQSSPQAHGQSRGATSPRLGLTPRPAQVRHQSPQEPLHVRMHSPTRVRGSSANVPAMNVSMDAGARGRHPGSSANVPPANFAMDAIARGRAVLGPRPSAWR